jgi:hypothetical protein
VTLNVGTGTAASQTINNTIHMKEHRIMKHISFIGFRRWLLAGTLALGTITTVTTPGFAQVIPGEPDHLKCYEVIQDQNPMGVNEVDLVNKFGLEPGCHVANKARRYCTPARKFIEGGNGNDPRGTTLNTDFTCYQLECPDSPVRELIIDDQFGNRHIRIDDAVMLCTPTVLEEVVD